MNQQQELIRTKPKSKQGVQDVVKRPERTQAQRKQALEPAAALRVQSYMWLLRPRERGRGRKSNPGLELIGAHTVSNMARQSAVSGIYKAIQYVTYVFQL